MRSQFRLLAISSLFSVLGCSQASDPTFSAEAEKRVSAADSAPRPSSTPADTGAEPPFSSELIAQSGTLPSEARAPEAEPPSQPQPQPQPATESVTPPTNIAGGSLYCEEISPDLTPPESTRVACSLIVNKERVNASDLFTTVVWGAEQIPATAVDVQVQAPNRPFAVIYKISGTTPQERKSRAATAVYTALVTQADGSGGKLEGKKKDSFLSWEPHQRQNLSPLAFQGGTEAGGVPLYVCRMYVGQSIITGKLAFEDTATNSPRSCFGVDGSNREVSTLDGYRTEVLHYDSSSALKLRWTKFSGSIPTTALVGGQDSSGRPIYICRGLESRALGTNQMPNDKAGEFTPGHVRPGARACLYEFFGLTSVADFEILEIDGAI